MEIGISVQNLHKSYGKKEVLKGISFEVSMGEVFTLIGPNGSGKTTIMEILEGVRSFDSGTFSIFGRSPGERFVKERIGVAMQDSQPLSYLRVRELLQMYCTIYEQNLPIQEVIDSVLLTGKERQLVRNLSGGEKQLLNVAVAMLHDPLILFLDEPSSGLDPEARKQLWTTLLRLKQKGKTILMTTHNMEEAERLSDRVAILKGGVLRSQGSPHTLLESLGMKKRIDFEFDEIQEKVITGLKERFHLVKRGDESFSIFTLNVERDMEIFLNTATAEGGSLRSMAIHVPDLEDVYFAITGSTE